MMRAGRPTATTSSGSVMPVGTSVPFAEEDAVTEDGAGHEDRRVADLAQVADAWHQRRDSGDRRSCDDR